MNKVLSLLVKILLILVLSSPFFLLYWLFTEPSKCLAFLIVCFGLIFFVLLPLALVLLFLSGCVTLIAYVFKSFWS
jgi:hypothetical protein